MDLQSYLGGILKPGALEFVEWLVNHPAWEWPVILAQIVGAVWTLSRGPVLAYRGSRAVCQRTGAVCARAYRWLRPEPDPLLTELLAALTDPEAVYGVIDTPGGVRGQILCGEAEFHVGQLGLVEQHRYSLEAVFLAGKCVSHPMLGAGWFVLQRAVRETALNIERQREQQAQQVVAQDAARRKQEALEALRRRREQQAGGAPPGWTPPGAGA